MSSSVRRFVADAADDSHEARERMRKYVGDVNACDEAGITALLAAIFAHNVGTVSMLLQWEGVDVETPVRGKPPMVWALLHPRDCHEVIRVIHQQRVVNLYAPVHAVGAKRYLSGQERVGAEVGVHGHAIPWLPLCPSGGD